MIRSHFNVFEPGSLSEGVEAVGGVVFSGISGDFTLGDLGFVISGGLVVTRGLISVSSVTTLWMSTTYVNENL